MLVCIFRINYFLSHTSPTPTQGWNKGGKICSEGKENIDSEGESDEEEEDESLKTGEVLSSESAAFDFKKALETRAKTQF